MTDPEDMLMGSYTTDWSVGIKFLQFHKNSSLHATTASLSQGRWNAPADATTAYHVKTNEPKTMVKCLLLLQFV